MSVLDQTVGQLQGDVSGLKDRVVEIQKTLEGQDDKLDQLIAYHNQDKGARAVARWAFSVVGSGGFVGWLWEHFHR